MPKLLFVEDNLIYRENFIELLEKLRGLEIVTASSFNEAVEILTDQRVDSFDIVLTDLNFLQDPQDPGSMGSYGTGLAMFIDGEKKNKEGKPTVLMITSNPRHNLAMEYEEEGTILKIFHKRHARDCVQFIKGQLKL